MGRYFVRLDHRHTMLRAYGLDIGHWPSVTQTTKLAAHGPFEFVFFFSVTDACYMCIMETKEWHSLDYVEAYFSSEL